MVGSTGARWSEIANFEQIFARSASAITPSEKSFINFNFKFNRKSVTRPLLPEILHQTDRVLAKSLIFDLFSLLVTQP